MFNFLNIYNYYMDEQLQTLLCHSVHIVNSLQAVQMGMNMMQNSKCFCYKFNDFNGNSKIYNQFGLKRIDNLARLGGSGDSIDNIYICLIRNSQVFLGLYEAVGMARRLVSRGKNLVYTFSYGTLGTKKYTGEALIELADSVDYNSCNTIDLSYLC